MPIVYRLFPILLSLVAIGLIFYFVPPPLSWPEASVWQILAFLLPMLALVTFFVNAFLDFLPRSVSIGLGAIVLLVLQMIQELNLALIAITMIIVVLLFTAFKKPAHKPRKDLNKTFKLPEAFKPKQKKRKPRINV